MPKGGLKAAALIAAAPSADAQIDNRAARTGREALPPDVVAALDASGRPQTIYPINGTETFTGTVIKADEIVFAPGARLVIATKNKPWVVISAKRWKFADPLQTTRIERDFRYVPTPGAPGKAGAHGANNLGETNRRGDDGGHGKNGGNGGDAATPKIPHIYLVADEFLHPDGRPLPGYLRMALIFPGYDGGKGGDGGRGGNGGKAGNGKKGATSAFDCKEGGGRGGDGGNAGRGGRGGDGGAGGDGANLTFVATRPVVELLSYVSIVNVAGVPGARGAGGKAGTRGARGEGAGRNGFCGPTSAGSPGKTPDPATLGPGVAGKEGRKGAVTAYTVTDGPATF